MEAWLRLVDVWISTPVGAVGGLVSFAIVRRACIDDGERSVLALRFHLLEIATDLLGGTLSVLAALHLTYLNLRGCGILFSTIKAFESLFAQPVFLFNQAWRTGDDVLSQGE